MAMDIISKAKKLLLNLTLKENDHLRKKWYDLSNANPDDVIKIEKGKLIIFDKFNLNNQNL